MNCLLNQDQVKVAFLVKNGPFFACTNATYHPKRAHDSGLTEIERLETATVSEFSF